MSVVLALYNFDVEHSNNSESKKKSRLHEKPWRQLHCTQPFQTLPGTIVNLGVHIFAFYFAQTYILWLLVIAQGSLYSATEPLPA